MSILNKIFAATLGVSYLTLASVCLYAKDKPKPVKLNSRHNVVIGFNIGKTLFYKDASSFQNNRKNGANYLSTNSFMITKPLNNYFKIESRLSYNVQTTNGIGLGNKYSPYSLAVPTTIQYYFIPKNKKCALHPYCGAGFEYNLNLNNSSANERKDLLNTSSVPQPGTRYVSILFTQGITYEVNTKIEVKRINTFYPGQ